MARLVDAARLGIVAAIIAIAPSSIAFAQQNQILICSDQPNGPSGFQIELDYVNRRVSYQGQWYAADFSDRMIQWKTPRYEPGTGLVQLALQVSLDRVAGTIGFVPDCLPRDWDICRGFAAYCRPGQRQF